MDNTSVDISHPIAYATFTRRARALVIDTAVVAGGVVMLVLLSSFVDQLPGSGLVMVLAMIGLLVLYEPVLVWRLGATIGHRSANIHVVSTRSGGPPSLGSAFVRFWQKTILGLPSFVAMAFTPRYQAFSRSRVPHDCADP